jgi:hypothetical protein
MEITAKESYIDYLKSFIKDNMSGYEGKKFDDGRELADMLTEGINANGTATYSAYEAKQYIIEWFDDCGDFVNWYQNDFGDPTHNAFERPELFHCQMVIIGIENMLSQIETLDNPFTLTKYRMNKIIQAIENITEVF